MYRLRRVTGKERRFLGVCGGISKYMDPEMDPAVVRVIWTLLTILNLPFMILLYFVLGIALKQECVTITEENKTYSS